MNKMGYQIASAISLIVRAYVCYYTVETTPIFASDLKGLVLGQVVSIYVILRIVAYFIVGNVLHYEKGSAPTLGVMLYGIIHLILVMICWGILAILTMMSILPIS